MRASANAPGVRGSSWGRCSSLGATLRIATFVLIVATAIAPGRAAALEPSPELQTRMTGTFVADEPSDQIDARLRGVVEQVVAPMNFLIRPIARSRLSGVVTYCKGYQLELSAAQVVVRCDDLPEIRRKLDNSEGKVAGLQGDPVDVRVTVASGSVDLAFVAEDGGRTTSYSFPDPDAMVVTIRLTSSQLETPLEWTVRYRRVRESPAAAATGD